MNKADTTEAKNKITAGRDTCGGCFFGVIIEIDPDKEEVTGIFGIGISDKEAEEIARRVGITIGSNWSVEQLILWIMAYFMK